MKEVKGTRTVEVEVTKYEFEAKKGDYNESLTIENGEIVRTDSWNSRDGGWTLKGEVGFAQSCKSAIRFIVDQKPEELKNIYHKLSEGPMKDFCRELQQEKIQELQF